MAEKVSILGKPFWLETCCACKIEFAMRDDLHTIARARREQFRFYCPNGHSQYYPTGETEADALRRERDRLKQNAVYLEEQNRTLRAAKDAADRRMSAARGQVTRIRNRVSRGVCPCCNRSFTNLARHMATKHEGFAAEEASDAA